MSNPVWSTTVDWICIGSGAGGCGAAIAGTIKGLSTLLLEQALRIGGLAAQSSGILWVPCNYLLYAAGIDDSREAALAYFRYTGAGENDPAYMAAYVDNATRVLAYLYQHAQIEFALLDLTEFYYRVSTK